MTVSNLSPGSLQFSNSDRAALKKVHGAAIPQRDPGPHNLRISVTPCLRRRLRVTYDGRIFASFFSDKIARERSNIITEVDQGYSAPISGERDAFSGTVKRSKG